MKALSPVKLYLSDHNVLLVRVVYDDRGPHPTNAVLDSVHFLG